MNIPNLAPADELAEVRATLKTLGERENALKALVINDPSARTGNAYCVEILEVTTNRLDVKELRAAYPAETAEHTHPVTTTRVELRAVDQDTGEIVSPQRKTAQRRAVVQDVVREWLKDNPGQDRLKMPPDEFKQRLAAKNGSRP